MDITKVRVALDGPSGAGKSTVAKALAAKMGYVYVDTGALYRTVGLFAAQNGIEIDNISDIIPHLHEANINLVYEDGTQHVILNGSDVGDTIRTPSASMYASAVSKLPEVRQYLLKVQKDIAAKGGVIMDGRDIGTVIMPDAEVKIFMTATVEERARRRYKELSEKGEKQTYESVLEDIIKRDKNDSERETAPLKPADDAIMFVNDGYDVEGSADYIISIIKSACSNDGGDK